MRILTAVAAASLFGAAAFAADTAPVPRKSPEFVIHFPGKADGLLSSYRGKVVALLFMHTTCPHCQEDSGVFEELYKQYASKGFEPVAVTWDEHAQQNLSRFIGMHNLTYPAGWSGRDEVLDYLQISPLQRTVVPQIVWLDRKGMIRSQTPTLGDSKMLSQDYWREMIQKLTAEQESTSKKSAQHARAAHRGV